MIEGKRGPQNRSVHKSTRGFEDRTLPSRAQKNHYETDFFLKRRILVAGQEKLCEQPECT